MSRIQYNGYAKIAPLWERLLGLFAGEWQRRGYGAGAHRAAEESIYRFLARFPEAQQPEDISQIEVLDYVRARKLKVRKAAVEQELLACQEFWDFLRYQQGYFLADPFALALRPSRWKQQVSVQSSPVDSSSIPVEKRSSAIGPKPQPTPEA